ncbi:MAG TPA: hypothetical protein ENH12_01215 [Proteobacteria bacterium]|nr:hypothetical protein [Pseudomonadota bacterium]
MADKKVVRFRLADNLAQTHAGFIQKRLFGFLVIPLAIELSLANDNCSGVFSLFLRNIYRLVTNSSLIIP